STAGLTSASVLKLQSISPRTTLHSWSSLAAGLATRRCSAPRPKGQGGHDHINEQPQHFWDALFARKGLALDELSTKIVRDLFRERSVVSWLCKNSRVYRRG